jgi:sirohydrochlorin ferrochelatase
VKSALLILVHGSPNPAANDEMFRVLKVIRSRGVYAIVEAGFLECNDPDIPAAIEKCISQGAQEIVAVPYFLHTGRHVADDLPAIFEAAQAKYQAVQFRLSNFLGKSQKITAILKSRALSATEWNG